MADDRRFFYDKAVTAGDTVALDGDEFFHMVNVLRLRENDPVVLLSGLNEEICAVIAKIDKKQALLKVESVQKCEREPACHVTLFQATLKGEKMELVAQKFTELGGAEFQPFESKFCVAGFSENKLIRLQKITDEAVKQCKRAKRVSVQSSISFLEMTKRLKNFDCVIFANECEKKAPLKGVLAGYKNVAIIVGSEGGFAPEEIDSLKELAVSITLGKRILRAETAAVALTALVMYELNELE